VLAAERATVVAAAMARLPEQQRVTLVLAAGELNSAEIGAALGVPAGTVRYRLSLARRTLAEALADYDDPQEEPCASTMTWRPGPPPYACPRLTPPRSSSGS
jgi:RNA polymerase sigma-70 factor, ECF subfamily